MIEKPIQKTKTSFWEIIKANSIIIPQIQRDYAQGREEKDVIEIRNRILDKFYTAIKTPLPIDIDFIYGYNQDEKFIPLDGQQRLTTLFLIHLYIAKRAKSLQLFELKKFRYETRQSSADFCNALLQSEIIFKSEINLKDWIVDQHWFFHSWIKDPTINGMLTMIQSIHLKFSSPSEDFIMLWNNLISITPITFNFISIENSGMNDELYIKMNSRGKPLTRFENFKVWFEKKYPNNKYWQNKIDNDWTNLFWKYRSTYNANNSNHNSMDEEFMQFLNGMIMFGLAQKEKKEEVLFFANNNEIALSKYEEKELDIYSINEVVFIIKTLDWFCKYNNSISGILKNINFWQNKSIFEAFISDKLTYSDRVRFYALAHFANRLNGNNLEENNFKQWVRVTRNLIENTTIDSPETFIGAINSIRSIDKHCLNICEYLQNADNKISFFLSSQVEEEKLKVSLIEKDINWEKAFLNLENHELFRGNIGFLLLNDINSNIAQFQTESDTASSLFDKNGSVEEIKKDYLLIRATLAQSSVSGNIRLLDNGENWRTLLKRKDVQPSIFKIISAIGRKSKNDIELYLNSIIDNFSSKAILWKFHVIKFKILLTSNTSRSKFIKQYEERYYLFNNENGNWINNDNQILLSNYRNELIDILLNYSNEIKLDASNDWLVIVDQMTNKKFYRGFKVWLNKNLGNYKLTFEFTPAILIIGLRNELKDIVDVSINDWYKYPDYIVSRSFEIPKTEEELLTCFEKIKVALHQIEKMVTIKSIKL